MIVVKKEGICPNCRHGNLWSHTDNDGSRPKWCDYCHGNPKYKKEPKVEKNKKGN